MRSWCAVCGGYPAHKRRVERSGVGGRQLADYEDARLRQPRMHLPALESGEHPTPHVLHVNRARLEQLVVQRLPLGCGLLARGVPRPLRAGACVDRDARAFKQHVVVQEREVRREDAGLACRASRD